MSLFSSIFKRLRPVNLKILQSYGLTFTSHKTSGLVTTICINSLSWIMKSLKKVLVTKSSGKMEKILLSRLWRRKIKRKEGRRKQSRWKKSRSSIFSLILKWTVMRKKMKMKKTKMFKTLNYSMRLHKQFIKKSFLNHWNIIWGWLKPLMIMKICKEMKRTMMKKMMTPRKKRKR